MEFDDIQAEMEYHLESARHFNKHKLDEIWPYLSEAQVDHLGQCQVCRKLVADNHFPVLYLGPVQDIAYKLKSTNATAEWLLEEWQERAGSSCLWTASLDFEDMGRKKAYHVNGCKKCRRLIGFLSRNGGEFSRDYGNMGDLLELVDMNTEIEQLQVSACWHNQMHGEERKVCWNNCLNPVSIGRDKVILVPRLGKENEHVKSCLHCQLVMFYHWHRRESLIDHHDTKTWKFFPVYMQEDQSTLEEHIRGCDRCQKKALARLRVNVYADKIALETFKSPKFGPVSSALRSVKRFWGEWVSSWRFHFGPDAMFSLKHPWAVWNERDRLLKIFRNQNLSEWEQLYRRNLTGEVSIEQLEQEFTKFFSH